MKKISGEKEEYPWRRRSVVKKKISGDQEEDPW